jgi:hypothetical protein
MRTSRSTSAFLACLVAALAIGAVLAPTASAAPAWRFNGMELVGTETIAGQAAQSTLTIPGLTNTCEEMDYAIGISNSAGTGKGQLNSLSFSSCTTDSIACTIEAIDAEVLPWTVSLKKVSNNNYVVFSKVKISIVYGGEECVLNEWEVQITGSAGALHSNVTETFTFSPASFSATGTELSAFGESVGWKGLFSTEATGAHFGESLTVS